MTLARRPNGYSKMDKEDPDEVLHRRAQFLIYKALEQADQYSRSRSRSKPNHSFLRIRLCRLKIKIGKRLKTLRKSSIVSLSAAKFGIYRQVIGQIKNWRQLFCRGGTDIAAQLPAPLLT